MDYIPIQIRLEIDLGPNTDLFINKARGINLECISLRLVAL